MPACLLVAHGPAAPGLLDSLSELAKGIEAETGTETRFAFLKGEGQRVPGTLKELKAGKVAVIPFFLSSGSRHVSEDLPALLRAGGAGKKVELRGAFDSSGELPALAAERAERLSRAKEKEALVLLIHGSIDPERNARAKACLEGPLERVKALSRFPEVRLAGLFHGELEALVKELEPRFARMIVLPLIFFEGEVLKEKVPALLGAIESKAELVCDARPLFPDQRIYRWLVKEVKGLR